jgi:hypothetical protein
MFQRSRIAILFMTLALMGTIALPSAHAKWFGKKKEKENQAVEQVRTYQPPPETAVSDYCEPYRREAAELAQKPFFMKPFYAPKRGIAMHKHRECKKALMEQERTYLKHVDIEQSPSLPKLKTDGPTTPAASPAPTTPTDAVGPAK